jgi:hypothetical protein
MILYKQNSKLSSIKIERSSIFLVSMQLWLCCHKSIIITYYIYNIEITTIIYCIIHFCGLVNSSFPASGKQ